MRRTLTAIAAAAALATAQADTGHENTSLIKIVGAVVTAVGTVKTVVEIWDWVTNRWIKPQHQWNAGELWNCGPACSFPSAGRPSTPDDDYKATIFIQRALPGRQWQPGQQIAVCDGFNCFIFEFDGTQFIAKGPSFKDPGVGHANTTPVPRYAPSSGSTGSIPSGLTPGWSPQAYIPNFEGPLKTGSLTMNWTGIQKRD